ncbi:MAG: F0F1 ATP synthase subunit delta [Clostridia bacterium]|nr:F0F1 ATP synthase subunit delta [Clostridia bacterium]
MAKLVSKTYSSALFELALEEHMIDTILAEYAFVKQSINENPEFFEIIVSPRIPLEEKKTILDKTFGNQISEVLLNFFKLLIDKKRSQVMMEVYDDFKALVDDHKGNIVATVESVIELDAAEIKNLEEKLNTLTGKNVSVNNVINPDIMGGLVVKVGDKIIDGSVKRKLENMKHELAQIII